MRPVIGTVLVLGAAFAPVAIQYSRHYELARASITGIYSCFLVFAACLVAPATRGGRELLGKLFGRNYRGPILFVLLMLPYFAYAAGTGDFHWLGLGRLVTIAAPPIFCYGFFPVHDNARFEWQDAFVGIWLVLVVLFHFFNGIWNVPVNLDFMGRLFVASLGAFCWTYLRPVPDLGYELTWSKRTLLGAAKNFTWFAAVAIPLGFVLGFTSWNPRWRGFGDFALTYLEIFLFVAVLEELFFRGFLQNLLSKSLGSWWRGQLIAACVFGLFHILHAPFPNWRYVILASIAGWFYGSAYRDGGTLLSSALVHAMVDTVWRTFLTKN